MEMIQSAAKTSLSIKIISAIVMLLDAGLLIAASLTRAPILCFVAIAMAAVTLLAYLWTPVRYAISEQRFIVFLRLGSRRFEPVVRCERASWNRSIAFSVRLFGNGGVFGGVGYFWNRTFGFFQAYVTSARKSDLVLVETDRQKIIISPRDVNAFIAAFAPLTVNN